MSAPRPLPVIQPGRPDGSPPVFDKVAVFGLGLIGGSIALAARRLWPSGLVIGVDNKDVLEKAVLLHAIDVAADDPIVAAEANLVILAAPVRQNLKLLGALPENVRGTAVVTDVGSTKRAMVEAARALPARLAFVGGHPLGGAPRGGIEYARHDLFAGRPWLFTPTGDDMGPVLERLCAFVGALGAEPHLMRPEEHDRLLAFVSHLPQLTASGLMHVVGSAVKSEGLTFSGRGLLDVTRLASSPAGIWRDICLTNADEIGAALDELIAVLTSLRGQLSSGEALDRLFESAADWREQLAKLREAKREG